MRVAGVYNDDELRGNDGKRHYAEIIRKMDESSDTGKCPCCAGRRPAPNVTTPQA
jgi:hypothetical protein